MFLPFMSSYNGTNCYDDDDAGRFSFFISWDLELTNYSSSAFGSNSLVFEIDALQC